MFYNMVHRVYKGSVRMSKLGELLRDLRGNRSLREIAEITELSHTYIADVEKGYRRGSKKPLNPSPETLKRLATAYNYPYEKLMEIAGYIGGNNETLSAESIKNDDLLKDLEKVHNKVDKGSYAHVGGLSLEDLDEEDKEILVSSLKNIMVLAERMAKYKVEKKD